MRGGSTLELCMSLSWLANPSPVEALEASVEFHSYGARGRAMATSRSGVGVGVGVGVGLGLGFG